MPLDVYLCHAPADIDLALQIKYRLDRCAEANVWLEPCGRGTEQTMAQAWDGGLSSGAILLLLSADAIPIALPRKDWDALLQHVDAHAVPPVGALLLNDCPYPRLLERRRFVRHAGAPAAALREIAQWIVSAHRIEPPRFVAAPLPWFQRRERELRDLEDALVDDSGIVAVVGENPRCGKTSLAQEFARRYDSHFRDLLWITCGARTRTAIRAEIAASMGIAEDDRIESVLENHRFLLVLDDVVEIPINPRANGRASVLATARSPELRLPQHGRRIEVAAVSSPSPNVASIDPIERQFLDAASACRAQEFAAALAARIADLDDSAARAACEHLAALRLIDPLDAAGARFRIVAAIDPSDDIRRRHAETLRAIFAEWRREPARCRALIAEFEIALDWGLSRDWPLAVALADRGFAFLRSENRVQEAAELYRRLRQNARARGDSGVAENCSWELSWIENESGGIRPVSMSAGQIAFDFA